MAGFIERKVAAPFFNLGGHRDFLKEALEIPVIRATAKGLFGRVMQEEDQPDFGKVLTQTTEAARRNLEGLFPKISKGALNVESFHVATIALSSVFTKFWVSWEEIERLFSYPKPKDYDREAEQFFWDLNQGIAFLRFPQLFGGADRAVHAVNHMFLAFEYFYSLHYGLNIEREVPRFLDLYLNYCRLCTNSRNRAEEFSELVGILYELRSTLSREAIGDAAKDLFGIEGERSMRGWFSADREQDLMADVLGAAIGGWSAKKLVVDGRGWEDIKPVLSRLDDPKWKDKSASPVFPPV